MSKSQQSGDSSTDRISKIPNDRLSMADVLALDRSHCVMCIRDVPDAEEDGPAFWMIDPPNDDRDDFYLACERCKNSIQEDIGELREKKQGEDDGKSAIPSVAEYREQVPDDALDVYDYLISQNASPRVAAATATYIFGRVSGQESSQTVIADHFGTTPSSISNWHRSLWDQYDEWSIERPYSTSELLEELPHQSIPPEHEKRPDYGPTKEDFLEQVRELADLEESGFNSETENLTRPEIEQLTGTADSLQHKELLEDEFGLTFGPGEDATAQLMVNLNKSGIRKIRDQLSAEGSEKHE